MIKYILYSVIALFLLLVGFWIILENEGRLGNNYYYLSEFNAMDYGYPEKGGVVYKSMHKNSFDEIKIENNVIDESLEVKGNFIFGQQRDKGYFIINTQNDSVYKNLSPKEYKSRKLKIQRSFWD